MPRLAPLVFFFVGAIAHDSVRPRSLSGLHSGAFAAAHRELVRADLAAHLHAELAAHPTHGSACAWSHSTAGYWEACGGASGNLGTFSRLSSALAQTACCAFANGSCAGFSFACDDFPACETGSGYYKANVDCGFVSSAGVEGWAQPSRLPVLPNVSISASPSVLPGDMGVVNISFSFLSGEVNRTTDWVGQVCVGFPIQDYIEFAPIDYFNDWHGGSGWLTFPVFRSRCDVEFVFFRGKQPLWPSGVALARSNSITWEGSWQDAPFHTHMSFGGEDTQHSMIVSFSTNSTPAGGVLVQVGSAPGVYDLPNATAAESTTYGADDLCNAPANSTSIDFWQHPGWFHHVLVRGLAPGTRYYVRPVAGGVPGAEASFVTGKALGPNVPVTFASFGDMSVTQYVLDGDSEKDAPDGGPGAVGTSQRLRARIDGAGDIDFVTHYGDL